MSMSRALMTTLMSWIYDYLSVTAVARGLGTMEIVAGFSLRCAMCGRAPRQLAAHWLWCCF